MTHMKRFTILILLALAATTASAQDKYPSKPIKVVVPFGPGSATDIVMRILGEQMRPILGQPVLVENKPGAFGILAIEDMARAKPDGYTLQIGNPGTNVLTPIVYKKKFKIDYDKDVILVTRLSEIPLVLGATTKDFPPKTFAEFIAYAKANPGKVRYASVGVGSNNHYDTEAFAQWAGIVLTHLPNKGGGAAITNGLWSALYAPAATPRDVLEIVRRAAVQALGSEQVTTAFRQQMIKAVPSASLEDAQAWNKAELAYWKKVTDDVKVELPD